MRNYLFLIIILLTTLLVFSDLTVIYSAAEETENAINTFNIEYEKIDLEKSGISSSGSSGNWMIRVNLKGEIIGAVDSNMETLDGELDVIFFINGHQGNNYQDELKRELIFDNGNAEFIIEDWIIESEAERMSVSMPADLRLSIP